jgi:hypothetical protein
MPLSFSPRNIFKRAALDRNTYKERYINFSPCTNLATSDNNLDRQSRV